MANHPSAVKRYRQSLKRKLINSKSAHKLKTQLKKLKTAIAAKKTADAKGLFRQRSVSSTSQFKRALSRRTRPPVTSLA